MLESSNKKPSPPGKPKRPLSAYNIFFRGERKRILLKSLELQELSPEEFANALKSSKDRPHRKTKGKLSFKALTHQVSSKWKTVDPITRKMCEDEAKIRKERYTRVLALWKQENAVNCRSDPVSSDDEDKSTVSLCSAASLPIYLSKYELKCSTNSSTIVPAPWACPVKEERMVTSANTSRIFKQERIFHSTNSSSTVQAGRMFFPTGPSRIVPASLASPVKEEENSVPALLANPAKHARRMFTSNVVPPWGNPPLHEWENKAFRTFTSAPTCTRSEQSFQLKKNSDISVLSSELDEESLDFLPSL